ncbi:MAG: GNAT family N-acetyltransferase [Ruminococcaceae bacterium]|nr:GNAT family N-acetyltransferase [Oscillospiraceae bacterium]
MRGKNQRIRKKMKKEKIYRVFSHIPELTTPRLTLRRMMVADTSDMYEYASRPDVTKYLTWNPHPDRNYTREYLEYLGNRYAAGMFYDWAVVYEPDCKMVGSCGFTSFNCTSDSAEVGYVLNPEYWGRGIAAEALDRILEFGFDSLGLHRIEARFIEGNEQSRRVMEKVGMSFEGILREGMLVKGSYVNVGVCSILLREWKELHQK